MNPNDSSLFERATERSVDLEPGPIHYREVGEGKPLLFVHGLLVNGFLWRKVVPPLAERFRCVVPDLPLGSHRTPMQPGADLSPPGLARILAAFIEATGLKRATVVANDTGGALAQILATTRADLVDELVLTPCDMFDNFLPPLFRPLQWIGSSPLGLALVLQPMRFEAMRNTPIGFGWLAKHGIEGKITDRYLRCALASARVRRDAAEVLRGISPHYTAAAAEKLRDFDHPTLLAWAREDRVFPSDHAHRMAQILPNARVEMIDDSYAFVPEDQPERLATSISEFLG